MESAPIRYRMYGTLPWLWLLFVVLFTFIGVPVVVVGTIVSDQPGPPIFFFLMMGFVIAWFWYAALVFLSFEVQLWPESGRLVFRSVLKTRETNVDDVTAIQPAFGGLDYATVVISYRGGQARILRALDPGLTDLVRRVQERNPAVRLRGV